MSDTIQRLGAALSGRYDVQREVGAGGMATVYLARDLRHKRPVALKVVRPELGGPEGIERFLREIDLAARLQHPHILPVFDSGVVDDGTGSPLPYFVMPYVEEENLRQRLQREGRLSVETATGIAGEVADALSYAHAHGVVHRDIKPENILLSGGHAVVTDFGVAKALESGAATVSGDGPNSLTRAGIAIGTPLYMSPEQATADVVDARADQYSLGCVLYEMLAGEPPFTGPTQRSVIAKSLSAQRPRVSRIRSEVPAELEQVLLRSIALEPSARYPDMTAFGEALRKARAAPTRSARRRFYAASALALLTAAAIGGWLASRAPARHVAPAAETLAVLPFRTSGPGVEFLSEGMMDLLATNLRGVGGINTVDPRAVLREWGRTRGTDDLSRAIAVGRDLDAGSVVLGRAVSTGGRVRVTADLYQLDGERLGRAQVDGSADSVLSVVDRLSLALVRDVWRSREPVPNLRLASLTTDSIEALRSYLQGERYYRRLAWDSAIGAYTRAVETDSTFALAHLRRAQAIGWIEGYGNINSHQAVAAAARFASRLPLRDRRLLTGYRLFDQGKPAAIDSLRAYVASSPEDVEGWFLLGESMFHTASFRPSPPDSIAAMFDSVLRRDSTLVPALIHPLQLSLLYRDSVRFRRYFPGFARAAPDQVRAVRTAAGMIWGPRPSGSAILAALLQHPSWIVQAALSAYQRPDATSDNVLQAFGVGLSAGPQSPEYLSRGLAVRAHALAGLGRWREASVVLDSLRSLDPEKATDIEVWSIVLGLTPPSLNPALDSIVRALPPGAEAQYARGMLHLLRGRVAEGRRELARALATRSPQTPSQMRGLMMAGDGLGMILQGDTMAGIRRLRQGLDTAAAPNMGEESSYLRLQLALALAARPESRTEGIRWLEYGFDHQPLYLPLTHLALGRTYEAAGQRDSAAYHYRRFLRFWDKASPQLQSRVQEAQHGLSEVTGEQPRP